MAKVLVRANSSSTLFCDIDLSSNEWFSLLPENISVFKMEEIRRPCSAYIDGIFPGSVAYENNKQISRIQKFANFIEFSKITSDELVPYSGQQFLTTKFYDHRKIGWASYEIKKKVADESEVMGYCINGDIYCAEDKDEAYKIFYEVVYRSLVAKNAAFNKLVKMLRDDVSLNLINGDKEFAIYLKKVLLNSIKEDN